jgi:hypothetical protein
MAGVLLKAVAVEGISDSSAMKASFPALAFATGVPAFVTKAGIAPPPAGAAARDSAFVGSINGPGDEAGDSAFVGWAKGPAAE